MAAKTALVLSAGGMYGAYQVGAWKVLSQELRPDIVIGASIGSLNGWCIAGGCTPEELEKQWLGNPDFARRHRFRIPRKPLQGVMDDSVFRSWVQELHRSFTPQVEYGVVLTDLVRLRPRLFRAPGVTWQHLAASCAILGVLPQYRIDGRTYTDGGMLGALPLWAAVAMGADRVIAVNVFPKMPWAVVRGVVGGLRRVSRFRPVLPKALNILCIGPSRPLGNVKEAMSWEQRRIASWIRIGQEEAAQQLRDWKRARLA